MEKAKQKFSNLSNYLKDDTNTEKPDYTNPINSVDGVGIGKSTGAGSTTIGTEDVDPTKGASYGFIGPSAYNNDRAYYDVIGELLAGELSNEKIANTEMGITQGGFEDSSMVGDLTELGFSADTRDEIAANGGSIGIKYNDNGQAYSKNDNGSFTHTDGTTVNFTDSKGNPGNAPAVETFSPPAKTATPTPVYTPPAYIPPTEDNNGGNDGLDDSSSDYSDDGAGGWT